MNVDKETTFESWNSLKELAEAGDSLRLEAFIESIGPNEAFRALLRLRTEDREKVLTTLSPEEAADLIEEIPDEHAADLIEELPVENAASIVSEMDSDDQADVLGNLNVEDAEAILAEMTPEEAEDARRLIPYANDVAGGLMVTEFLAYPDTAVVRDVIDDLSDRAEKGMSREVYAYVISPTDRLVGAVDLRDLVLAC